MAEKFDVLNELGEFTGQVASREDCHKKGLWHRAVKEELGLDLNDDDIKYLVGSTSINIKGNIINKHYNECYLIKKDIDVSKIKLQKEEVSEVKYFSKEDILNRISNNFEGLTEKTGPWNFLKRILESKLY